MLSFLVNLRLMVQRLAKINVWFSAFHERHRYSLLSNGRGLCIFFLLAMRWDEYKLFFWRKINGFNAPLIFKNNLIYKS